MNYEQSSDNFTELLYDFLDGALAPENETRLFAALTQDADLRAELKEQLHINATIQTDEYAFTPPAASGEAIFARLGFAAEAGDTVAAPILATPTVASPAIATVSLAARAGIAFRRGSSLVLVALLSSLLTAWLLRSSGNGYGGDITNGGFLSRFGNNGGNGYGGNGSSGAPPFHGSFAESGAGTSPQPFVIADTVFQTVIKRVIIRQEQAPSDATMATAYPALYSTLSSLPETAQAELTLSTNPQTSLGATLPKVMLVQDSTQKSAPTQTPVVQPATPAPLTGITIGARGMVSRSVIWASVPAKETFPSNAALYALYNLSAHHSIGVEFGQESFFQRYYFTNPQGVEFRVEQNPTFVWGGLAYRYTMFPESTFSPFAHVVAGATQIGGLGRGMVGVSYAPDARTQFHLGAEAANLFYQSDGAWFMSPKLGVSYGVSIKF